MKHYLSLFMTTVFVCCLATCPMLWAQDGNVEGSLTYDGETIAIQQVTVHEQEHPFEEEETTYLVTLSEQTIPYLEVDDICPGKYGNRVVQFLVDKNQGVLSTNFCFQGGNSSGHTFELTFDSFGPTEYSGRVAASFDVFDLKLAFDLEFRALLPEEMPGEPLPPGGGEPGADYLAWMSAVKSGDLERIKAMLPPEQVEGFESLPLEEQQENVEFLQLMAPDEIEVLGGRRVDETVYLEVKATMDGEPASGEIKLEYLGGRWVAVGESWS